MGEIKRKKPKTKPKVKKTKMEKPAPHNPETGYITKNGQGKTVEVYDYQTGTTNIIIDKPRAALRPGRRVSRYGNVYYEFRANRSDRNPVEGL